MGRSVKNPYHEKRSQSISPRNLPILRSFVRRYGTAELSDQVISSRHEHARYPDYPGIRQ